MENNEYLSWAQNTIIRIGTVLDHRIGDIYNNESLIMTNESPKANCSVRLFQAKGYDTGLSSIMFHDHEGGFYPLELRLSEVYSEIDYAYLDSKGVNAIRSFLKSDADASEDISAEVLSLFKNITKEASRMFSSSPTGTFERIAWKYKRVMESGISYPYLPVLARLDLYNSLLSIDSRFAGSNIEEAMLIRREEHEEAIAEEAHERLTLFLSECLLDAITRAADQIAEMRHISEYAVLFLSMKMERGREYTFDELSLLFSLDKELMKNLFVIPALSSDRISIGSTASGEDTITLIG